MFETHDGMKYHNELLVTEFSGLTISLQLCICAVHVDTIISLVQVNFSGTIPSCLSISGIDNQSRVAI